MSPWVLYFSFPYIWLLQDNIMTLECRIFFFAAQCCADWFIFLLSIFQHNSSGLLRLGNTDKHFKKCMLLGHLIDHRPSNSILPLQVALAQRQAELFNLFLSLSLGTQVTMFKQAESWFRVHNDISCRPSSPKIKNGPPVHWALWTALLLLACGASVPWRGGQWHRN